MTAKDIIAALPLLTLVTFSLSMLTLDLFGKCSSRLVWLIAAVGSSWVMAFPHLYLDGTALNGLVYVDGVSFILYSILLGSALVTFLFNHEYLGKQRVESSFDIDMLLVLALCGAMVMVSSAHLIVLFIGFELLSVCVYVLTGSARKERASAEGALKYFILGAFSSAFLLYGMSMVYAASGSMLLADIATQITPDNIMLLVGIALLIFGFGFKVSLVPFHVWTPDVYQGAPVSIGAFMATVVKVAAFGSFLRVMYVAFAGIEETWTGLLWVLSAVTMTAGNLVALRQQSIKRMLAYSSIAHAGYALIGFLAFGPARGAEATMFYLATYSLMTLAAFGVVLAVTAGSRAQYSEDSLDSLSGLGWTHPFLGLTMTVAMLSLAGMPPLAGFIGKLYLFSAAVQAGFVGLAVIGAINSVVSMYYYLRVLVVLYFAKERKLDWSPPEKVPAIPRFALLAVTFGTIFLGLFADTLYPAIEAAVKSM